MRRVAVLLAMMFIPLGHLPSIAGAADNAFTAPVEIMGDGALRTWADALGLAGDGSASSPIRIEACTFDKGLHLFDVQLHFTVERCTFGVAAGYPNAIPARGGASILIEQSANITIRQSVVVGDAGVILAHSRAVHLLDNAIDADMPLGFVRADDIIVSENVVDGDLVWISASQGLRMHGNVGTVARFFIRSDSVDALITDNEFPSAGLQVGSLGVSVEANQLGYVSFYFDSFLYGCSWECPFYGEDVFPATPYSVAPSRLVDNELHSESAYHPTIYCGYYADQRTSLFVEGNILRPGTHITVDHCSDVTLRNMTLSGTANAVGVHVESTDRVRLDGLQTDRVRIRLFDVEDVTVAANKFMNFRTTGHEGYWFTRPLLDLEDVRNVTIIENAFDGGWQNLGLRAVRDAVVRGNDFDAGYLSILLNGVASLQNVTVYDNHFDAKTHNVYPITGSPGVRWNIDPSPGPNHIGGPTLGGNQWCTFWGWDLTADGLADADIETWLPQGPLAARAYSYGPGDAHPLVPWVVADPNGASAVAMGGRPAQCDHAPDAWNVDAP